MKIFIESYLILLQTKDRIKLIKSSFSKIDVFEAFLFSSSDFRIEPMVFFSPVFNFSCFVVISSLLVYSDFESERHSWSFMNMIHVHRTFKTENKGIFEGRFHCYIYASLKMSH